MDEERLRKFSVGFYNFRERCENYSEEELMEMLKNYEKYGRDFIAYGVAAIPSYFAEKKGNFVMDADGERLLGCYMSKGTLIIKGNAGASIGHCMSGGRIICLGKVENIDVSVTGGMIYAYKFGKVPEICKKFTSDLSPVVFEIYDMFPDYRKKILDVIRKNPEACISQANNKEKQEILAEIMGKSWKEIAIEFEKTRGGMW